MFWRVVWGVGEHRLLPALRGPDSPVRACSNVLFEEGGQEEDDINPSSFVWPRTREGRSLWSHSEVESHQPCTEPPQIPPSFLRLPTAVGPHTWDPVS